MLLTDQSARTARLLSIFVLSRDLFCSPLFATAMPFLTLCFFHPSPWPGGE